MNKLVLISLILGTTINAKTIINKCEATDCAYCYDDNKDKCLECEGGKGNVDVASIAEYWSTGGECAEQCLVQNDTIASLSYAYTDGSIFADLCIMNFYECPKGTCELAPNSKHCSFMCSHVPTPPTPPKKCKDIHCEYCQDFEKTECMQCKSDQKYYIQAANISNFANAGGLCSLTCNASEDAVLQITANIGTISFSSDVCLLDGKCAENICSLFTGCSEKCTAPPSPPTPPNPFPEWAKILLISLGGVAIVAIVFVIIYYCFQSQLQTINIPQI